MTDTTIRRVCALCGAAATAPGWFPAGWRIENEKGPIGLRGWGVFAERAYCPDCQRRRVLRVIDGGR